ncbi:GDP-D-glycero-alpha-D-manno-heptose dehydrogenase-like [Branchiostoma floridae x Branchiostoma japonicum]
MAALCRETRKDRVKLHSVKRQRNRTSDHVTLIWKALSGHHFALYQASFRRTFLHIKDAAMAFAFVLRNYEKMSGQAYNVGSETMNLTKAELAKKIQEFIPECVITLSDEGEDKDKRDYEVSYAKLRSLGYNTTLTVDDGIRKLVKVMPFLSDRELRTCSNV